jgi:hypothetical protein
VAVHFLGKTGLIDAQRDINTVEDLQTIGFLLVVQSSLQSPLLSVQQLGQPEEPLLPEYLQKHVEET